MLPNQYCHIYCRNQTLLSYNKCIVSKEVILTGLRANNDLHIGNYFGALLPIIDMAKKHAGDYQINLFVPDLHSFTTPINHNLLQGQIISTLRMFAASGLPLDNSDVHIYRQSYIPAHSELTIILNSFTTFGQLSRMTQFKDKTLSSLPRIDKKQNVNEQAVEVGTAIEIAHHRVSAGLFDYPVLMASDILLYNALYVPVGYDQTQHLEFTRDIAQRMNVKFKQELFTVPLEVKKQHELFAKDQGLRIMDLSDPTKKMSKSDASGKGVIFLNDTPEEARKKIMSATTDSEELVVYDPKKRPGISNLIEILALLENATPNEVAKRYEDQTMYGPLKEELASKMAYFLTEFQAKLAKVDDDKLMKKLEQSESEMNIVARETLTRVQKAVGLR